MQDRFYIGKIVKAQGIRGEVKIKTDAPDLPLAKKLKTLYLQPCQPDSEMFSITVKSLRTCGEFAFVSFSSVSDRNAAEALIGYIVYADFDDVVMGEGDYFVKDIVGCEVQLDSGKILGSITDVLQNGKSADVFVIGGEKEIMFPFLDGLVLKIDIEKKMLLLDEKRFNEVSVYAD